VSEAGYAPLAGQGKLETSWNGLNDDVMFQDTGFLELGNSPLDECLDDGFVPSCMYDRDP